MKWKNFFKITKGKLILLGIIFLISLFISPCTDYTPSKSNQEQILTVCSSIPSLFNPTEMVYDDGWPKVWGVFDLYKGGGEINYTKYLVIPFNLLIAYLLSCIIISAYYKLKK